MKRSKDLCHREVVMKLRPEMYPEEHDKILPKLLKEQVT